MVTEKDFLVQFSGLKLGEHRFEYLIENDFFDLFNYNEFNSTNIKVDLVLLKKTNMLELEFHQKGTVNVPCDVTNEDFDLPVEGYLKIFVKFGEEFNNESEDLLILPFAEFQLNVMQYIYEMIALSVPYKRVHPDVAAEYQVESEDDFDDLDFLNDDDLEMINDDEFADEETENTTSEDNSDNNKETDPRWDKLKQLLTDK